MQPIRATERAKADDPFVTSTLPEGPDGLPDSVAEILASYMASVTADTRIYRDALFGATAKLEIPVIRHPCGPRTNT